MNNEKYLNNIKQGLAKLVAELRMDAASNLHSINVLAEEFFRAFLNALFGWELTNANAVDFNAKGIDLLDPGRNIVVQVSSTTTHKKIQSSLNKSADHTGAHFYFVAIDDHLPDYRKPFEIPEGLAFNPAHDILDVTRLYEWVVHCEDRDGKQAIDIQSELSELVDKFFEFHNGWKALDLLPLGSGKSSTDYEYNAGTVSFLGRESEMALLLDFVRGNDAEPFRWWAVTAPGAAGKTRLAYELQNRLLAEGGWDVVALSPAAYRRENLLTLSEYLPARTLVIADYVQQHAEVLAEWMTALAAPNAQRKAPLRLLLLERDIKDENDRYLWLEEIKTADYHIPRHSYRPGPLELQPLRPETESDKDPLLVLIRDFADHVYQKETTKAQGSETAEARVISEAAERPVLTPLPPGGEAEIRRRLDSVDKDLVRPLFAMLLADAWVHDPAAQHWEREELLEYIVNREWAFAAKRLKPYYPARNLSLPNACRMIWLVATVLGANGGNGADLETLKAALPKHWELVEKCAAKHEDELLSLSLNPTEALLNEAGLFEQGKVPALRPDLLGEFFVLHSMEFMTKTEKNDFFSAILTKLEVTATFFKRCLLDYQHIVSNEDKICSWFLPEDLLLNDNRKSCLVWLLWVLFYDATNEQQREWILARMEIYAHFDKEGIEAASAYNHLGLAYNEQSDYQKARSFLEKAQSIWEMTKGKDSSYSAMTYNNLAEVYRTMGDYRKALELYNKDLSIEERMDPIDDLNISTTYNNIALVYYDLGEYSKALEYIKKAKDNREKVLDKDHPDLAQTYNTLAMVYYGMEDYEEAIEFYEKARSIWEKAFGPEHHVTATAYDNIAVVYCDVGNYSKAFDYHKKALIIREKALGKNHPDIATSYSNLGGICFKIGNYSKALEFGEKALSILEKTLGEDHLRTAVGYRNIAYIYGAIGDYLKALELFEKSRKIQEKVLGSDHPDTILSYSTLSEMYNAICNYPKALEFYQKTLSIKERVLGRNHPDTATCYNNIAGVYEHMGDYHTALVFLEKALSIREEVFGKNHLQTAVAYNNLGGINHCLGNERKALECYKTACEINEKILGKNQRINAIIYDNIGDILRDMGDLPAALEYFEKACDILIETCGQFHLDTAVNSIGQGLTYQRMGYYTKAFENYETARVIREKILGNNHPDTAQTWENIAQLYLECNNPSEALPWIYQALQVYNSVLGPDHPITKNAKLVYGYAFIWNKKLEEMGKS